MDLKVEEIEINNQGSINFYAIGSGAVRAVLKSCGRILDDVKLDPDVHGQLIPFIGGEPLHTGSIYFGKTIITLYHTGDTTIAFVPADKQVMCTGMYMQNCIINGKPNKLLYSGGIVCPRFSN